MENMKAMDMSDGPGNLRVIEIPKPAPGNSEVLVRVENSAVEDGERQVLNRTWVGLFLHSKKTPMVLGWNVAGIVEAVGPDADLQVGDKIWGHLDFDPFQKQGAYSEYVTMRASAVAKRPEQLSAAEAASFATPGLTALQALRDYGGLNSGNSLLIIGAGGGIGAVMISIAKQLGAEVYAVCSSKDIDKVKAHGADHVIDRKQTDFLQSDIKVDVILDTPSKYNYQQCASLLKDGGAYVDLHPWTLPAGLLLSLFSSKRCKFVQVDSKRKDLELLGRWLAEGMTLPVSVESEFPVTALQDAYQQRLNPARSGAVVVDVAAGW